MGACKSPQIDSYSLMFNLKTANDHEDENVTASIQSLEIICVAWQQLEYDGLGDSTFNIVAGSGKYGT